MFWHNSFKIIEDKQCNDNNVVLIPSKVASDYEKYMVQNLTQENCTVNNSRLQAGLVTFRICVYYSLL